MDKSDVESYVKRRIEDTKADYNREYPVNLDANSHRETIQGNCINIGEQSSYITAEPYKSTKINKNCVQVTIKSQKNRLKYVHVANLCSGIKIKTSVQCLQVGEKCDNITVHGDVKFLNVSEESINITVTGTVEYLNSSETSSTTVHGQVKHSSTE